MRISDWSSDVCSSDLTTMGDATDPGPLECSCGNVPDAARRRESRMRRVGSQEKLAAIRYRATALKICGDGSANIGRQRHDRLVPSLALNAEHIGRAHV